MRIDSKNSKSGWLQILVLCIFCLSCHTTAFDNKLRLKCSQVGPTRPNYPHLVNKSNSLLLAENSISTSSPVPQKQSSIAKINSLMLLFYGTLGSVMPYIPLYYRSIGISDSQIGILGAITPAVTFLVSPLWGAFADQTGWHKNIMLLTFIGSILVRCGFLAVSSNVYLLSLIVAGTAILYAPVKPLLDSAVLSMLADKKGYGKSRLFGQLGFGLGSFLVSPLLATNIRSLFFIQALLAIPTALLMASFRPKQQSARKEGVKIGEVLNLTLRDTRVLLFFLVVFSIGVSSGVIENFAYVRIAEVSVGRSDRLGVCRLVSSLCGGPMFWLSGYIVEKLGINGVLTCSLLSYVIRFSIYASMKNAWHALPAEALRGVTFALFWSGSTTYVYEIAPKALTATMLGILNGMYGGLGQSLGALLGGFIVKRFGIGPAFLRCAGAESIILGLFLLYQWRLKSKPPKTKDINNQDIISPPSLTLAESANLSVTVKNESNATHQELPILESRPDSDSINFEEERTNEETIENVQKGESQSEEEPALSSTAWSLNSEKPED